MAGIRFPGRVGLAAGMDKNGVGVRTWGALGFGHAEIGTVTARPQPGNEKPRLFRLPASGAIINRMGFNNAGAAALAIRPSRPPGSVAATGRSGFRSASRSGRPRSFPWTRPCRTTSARWGSSAPYADYLAVNVSSPNTPGLRSLQDAETLRALLAAMVSGTEVPIFVKLAPDLTDDALEEALAVCVETGAKGLIATNTTPRPDRVCSRRTCRVGARRAGSPEAPLTARTREVVRFLADRTELPIIGVGGVMTADDGRALLDAGASLLQVYTGFVYGGPPLIAALNRPGTARMRRHAGTRRVTGHGIDAESRAVRTPAATTRRPSGERSVPASTPIPRCCGPGG